MRVIIYGVSQSILTQAVAEGIASLGHQVDHRSHSGYRENNREPCDAIVLFGLHGGGGLALREYKEIKIPTLIIDYGYIRRGTQMNNNYIDKSKYYSISLNGLNGNSDSFPGPMGSDRWNSLGVPLVPWRSDGKYILVCGQKTNDVSIGNLNPIIWAKNTIVQIQEITNRPILFRPHPEDPAQKRPIGVPHLEGGEFVDNLKDIYAVVAYNSNALVEATVAGVPTFALGKGSMVAGLTNTNLAFLDRPKTFDREQWAYNLAWRQYTIDEFRSGLFWQYFLGEIDEDMPAVERKTQSVDSLAENPLAPIECPSVEPQLDFSTSEEDVVNPPEEISEKPRRISHRMRRKEKENNS